MNIENTDRPLGFLDERDVKRWNGKKAGFFLAILFLRILLFHQVFVDSSSEFRTAEFAYFFGPKRQSRCYETQVINQTMSYESIVKSKLNVMLNE